MNEQEIAAKKTADYIAGLRELADFYEQNPNINLPYEGRMCNFGIFGLSKAEIVTTVKAFGKCTKDYDANSVTILKTFPSGIKLQIYASRQEVCERIVVAKHTEPETVTPGKWVPEEVVPAREVEVVEWRCHPLLEAEEVGA